MKTRNHKVFMLILAMMILLGGVNGCTQKSKEALAEGESKKPAISGESIRISGSAPAYHLFELISRSYQKIHPNVQVKFLPPTHSAGGLAATFLGDADIGLIARPLKPQENKYKLQYLHLAKDGLVFATHPKVKVKNLTKQQIIHIYQGRIVNWKEAGGEDSPIIVLDRAEHTAAKIAMRELLFGAELEITGHAAQLEREAQMNEALTIIENSIGYTSLSQIILTDLDVNVLDLDGVTPTLANLAKNKYQLSRPFGLLVKPVPDRATMKFIDYIFGEQSRSIMERNGYVPFQMQLVIGIIPERNIIRQEDRYLPLVEYLSKKVGAKIKVVLQHLPSYGAITSEFINGKINAAFLGSYSYLQVKSLTDIEVIARPEKEGISGYKGLILVRKDSGIKDYRDMKGKRMALIKDTTAGEIFPRLYFKKNGIDNIDFYLGQVVYVASHDSAILKLINGEVDVAAAKDLVLRKLEKEDSTLVADLVILAESETVPENALVISRDIDIACYDCHKSNLNKLSVQGGDLYQVDLKSAIKEVLLHLHETKEGRSVLQEFEADKFLETTDAHYEPLSRMIKPLGLELNGDR